MLFRNIVFGIALLFVSPFRSSADYSFAVPPPPPREFRGVWIATVNNTDWPSKRGLSPAQQQAELIAIFDRATALRLNAVIFQVRPQGDAFYASSFEPWSEYLTGEMGKNPTYDPLAFAIREAHLRCLELHAWFNPYRALHSTHAGAIAATHVSITHPELVRKYGKYLWLDPGERDVQDYTLKVVMDVVNHYDIDAVHFDDYFYLSPRDAGTTNDFPDEVSWKKFGRGNRADWRRANVDSFIERTYRAIKAVKPWVKFGISPRGIWRPGFPQQIRGSDAYAEIYADSRKWLANGWCDYLAPQLYWPANPPQQSFNALLNWWSYQNPKHRHVWPGIAAYRAKEWSADEIPNQIWATRHQPGVDGYIFYNATNLFDNANLTSRLSQDIQAEPALVPMSPWLVSSSLPQTPNFRISWDRRGVWLSWNSPDKTTRAWVLQVRYLNVATGRFYWTTRVMPASQTNCWLNPSESPRLCDMAIRAVDRNGVDSDPVTLDKPGIRGLPLLQEMRMLRDGRRQYWENGVTVREIPAIRRPAPGTPSPMPEAPTTLPVSAPPPQTPPSVPTAPPVSLPTQHDQTPPGRGRLRSPKDL